MHRGKREVGKRAIRPRIGNRDANNGYLSTNRFPDLPLVQNSSPADSLFVRNVNEQCLQVLINVVVDSNGKVGGIIRFRWDDEDCCGEDIALI